MDIKTTILVIILALFLGVAIFFGINFVKGTPVTLSGKAFAGINEKINQVEPTPTPLPTPSPLPENADLGAEIQKIEMPDFSSDYQKLKEDINQ